MADNNDIDKDSGETIDDFSGLKFELDELQERSDSELSALESESDSVQLRSSELLSEENQEVIAQEAARQEMSEFQNTLQERDKGIKAMEEAQQFLEDELEDANAEIDRLRRELDKAIVENEEADYLRKEAEDARKQLESTLYKIQEGVEDAKVTDLRDERLHRNTRAIGMTQVVRGPMMKGLLLGTFAGALLLVMVLEVALFLADKEELFKWAFG